MNNKLIIVFVVIAAFLSSFANAENIDPYQTQAQYAWSENSGWLNFAPNAGSGVHIYSDHLEGYVWGENIGWINLSPSNYGGVYNDGAGNLSGYAWGENVGWINFNPQVFGDSTHYGVVIGADGKLSGWAWGENIGWIRFDDTKDYNVRVCVVSLDDLYNFSDQWLTTSSPADLDDSGNVDIADFGIFANYWQEYCPDNWGLK